MLVLQMGLGENIERARLAAGYTNAAEFARQIKVSPGTLGDWEAGRYKNLQLNSLLKIAKVAKCALEDLVVEVDADYDQLRRDLLRHGSDPQLTPHKGGAGVPASARVLTEEDVHALNDILDGAKTILAIGESIKTNGRTILRRQAATARVRASARPAHAGKRRRSAAS
jgi:transcriptional regulator with XRE-family HTH domain